MASQAQISANRRDARQISGPTIPEGKAARRIVQEQSQSPVGEATHP